MYMQSQELNVHAYTHAKKKNAAAMNNVTIPLNSNIATVYVSKYTCAIKVNKQVPAWCYIAMPPEALCSPYVDVLTFTFLYNVSSSPDQL